MPSVSATAAEIGLYGYLTEGMSAQCAGGDDGYHSADCLCVAGVHAGCHCFRD